MTKKKELPSALRNLAIGLIRGGHKISEISHILHINISTLHYLVRKWRTTGSTENISRCGRPKSFTTRASRQLKSIVKSHRNSSLEVITKLYNEGKERTLSKTGNKDTRYTVP